MLSVVRNILRMADCVVSKSAFAASNLAGFALCVALAAGGATAEAETVSQKEASRLAQVFFNAANGQVMGKPNLVYNGKKLTTDRLFSPFYIYNLPKGGFVIISAENKAMPVLGYSLNDNFDPESIGETTKALLKEYARDIEYIRYDSRVPEEAIAAWTDLYGYVADLLGARYDATDPDITEEEAAELIANIESTGRADELSSDIFTPQQWREMMGESLGRSESVAVGIECDGEFRPAIVHGRKGDYFRMVLDDRNDWLMRLMATEFLSYGQVADFGFTPVLELAEEEDIPFALHDDFMAEIRADEERRISSLEERLRPTEPVVRNIGGGHFEIALPEEVAMARIYSLQGSQVETRTFRGTATAVISLDAQPHGFYFALLNGVSGKPYGIKLWK